MSIQPNAIAQATSLDVGAKDKFRIAIRRQDGRYSHSWTFWGAGSHLYVASETVSGHIKIGFPVTGGLWVEFDKRFLGGMKVRGMEPPRSEAINWSRARIPHHGAVYVASLVFPSDYLTADAPPSSKQRPTFLFNAAPAGQALQLDFLYSVEDATFLRPRLHRIGFPPFLRTTLDNGVSVWTVVREREFDPRDLQRHDLPTNVIRIFGRNAIHPGEARTNFHEVLFSDPRKGGPLRIVEAGGPRIRPRTD